VRDSQGAARPNARYERNSDLTRSQCKRLRDFCFSFGPPETGPHPLFSDLCPTRDFANLKNEVPKTPQVNSAHMCGISFPAGGGTTSASTPLDPEVEREKLVIYDGSCGELRDRQR